MNEGPYGVFEVRLAPLSVDAFVGVVGGIGP